MGKGAITEGAEEDTISVFTDGSCTLKSGDGGWSFVVRYRDEIVMQHYGFAANTTIGAMELTAIHRALLTLEHHAAPLRIHTDSQYAKNAVTIWYKSWKKNCWRTATGSRVKNERLVKAVVRELNGHRPHRDVRVVWVKGHVPKTLKRDGKANPARTIEHDMNDLADKLAGEARKSKSTNWSLGE